MYYPYTVKDKTVYKQVVDITANVRPSDEMMNTIVNYYQDVITEGETPETVAYEYYANTFDHHLVIIANQMYDHKNDIPLTQRELEDYINEKYAYPYAIHHYEDPNGNIVDNLFDDGTDDQPYPKNVIPITNYEYESRLNESKRGIRVIKPAIADTVTELIKQQLAN